MVQPVASVALEKRLRALGPLEVAEGPFSRRIRFHQAWFRSEVLGLARFGRLPAPSDRPLGSVLHLEDAHCGANFVTKNALKLFLSRSLKGWGVAQTQCSTVMTSSQALSANLFGTLLSNPIWARRALSIALDLDVKALLDWWWELPSRSVTDIGGDKTVVDAVLLLETKHGAQLFVFEVKLADRYISRVVQLRGRYEELVDEAGVWKLDALDRVGRGTNQMFRVHAVGVAASRQLKLARHPAVVLLAHPGDTKASSVVTSYQTAVRTPHDAKLLDLGWLLQSMYVTAESDGAVSSAQTLLRRYTDLQASDALWELRVKAKQAEPQPLRNAGSSGDSKTQDDADSWPIRSRDAASAAGLAQAHTPPSYDHASPQHSWLKHE